MTHALPISLAFFTSTKGHHGRRTDWRVTLDHWDRQLPLSLFGARVAHVKVSPGDETLAADMVADLRARGFHVLTATADWSRGLSHGAAYLGDQVRVSADSITQSQPYTLLLEDDSPVLAHGCSLEDLLLRSCRLLATNHELVTVRTIRRADYDGGVPQLGAAEDGRAWFSPNTDFQPMVLRSLDFYRLGMTIEANPNLCQRVQCEALWAAILRSFSRTPHKHLVWRPHWAETVHIGIPQTEHEAALRQLTIPTLTP